MASGSKIIDVMIAGAQKAGTTSLGSYLDQHPDIESHQRLEMAFFVREDEYQLGYEQVYSNYFPANIENKTLLAKSVGIMYFPAAMQRLYDHNPNCKIIVILRNPVARAYSAYWFMRKVGLETADTFAEALALESSRKAENDPQMSACLYRDRGLYAQQIQNLYDCFGRDNVHVLLLEDLISAPDSTLDPILEFLQIDKTLKIDTSKKKNAAKQTRSKSVSRSIGGNQKITQSLKKVIPYRYLSATKRFIQGLNERPIDIPKIDPESERHLVEFFTPHNQDLAKLLNRSLAVWSPKK